MREGVRSNLTCPLSVEGSVVGFIFRSSREADTYHSKHIELQMAIAERLSQAVEKAWRIEQLEHANYAYMQMLGFVSHELKSPVASMVTDARILADGYLGEISPTQKVKLERLIRKGEYLLDLVREYLDLAHVEGGELEAAPAAQRVDVWQRGDRRRARAHAVAARVARHASRHGDCRKSPAPSSAVIPPCCASSS